MDIMTSLLSEEHDKRLYAEMVARWKQAGEAPLKLGCFACRVQGLCARCDYEQLCRKRGIEPKAWK